MGCIVFGVDIREEIEEQIVSLGAKFVLSNSKNFLEEIKEAQIIITSVNSINSHPPKIIRNSMLRELSHGTIIVDTSGGNVEDIKAESLVEFGNIKIVSSQYFASDIAYSASQLFSNNLYNFISRLDEIKKDEEVWSKISINELS
jgi:NAD(P) transhydrogenase subunit alpha